MAASSLTVEDTYRHISSFQTLIAKNIHTLQGLLFISCEMFQILHDIDEDLPLLKRWRDFANELQEG
jgi:hypothetical protein